MEANSIRQMLRTDPRVKACRSVPTEESRLAVSPDDIEAFSHRLVAIVDGTPAHFVVTVDETGHQSWAHRRGKRYYVPSKHTGDEAPFSVLPSSKRITLVACIGAYGSFLKPLSLFPRETIDADIALTGLTDKKVAIYSQPKGFIDGSIFSAWFEDVCIPEICRRCACCQYAGNIIILMDNCTTRAFQGFESLYTQHGIIICLLPLHISNQTQPFGRSTFGNGQTTPRSCQPHGER
jgi:hypothetical protein